MRRVKQRMIDIFDTYEYDWMNYKININDILTFHHILKKEDGGKYTIDNGALLTTRAHEHLHVIESIDKSIYDEINSVFKDINTQLYPPTVNQRELINLLLLKFELKNADVLIKKKEKVNSKKKRILLAIERRKLSQG